MRKICAVVIVAFLAAIGAKAQIFCWNVENYFDTFDDPATADEAFTPRGEYRWSKRRFEAKRNLIAKTIIASAECFGGRLPAIVGLCEVENGAVLRTLAEDTPLAKTRYRTIHRESPDPRGIDVALLYDSSRVEVLICGFITISGFATREILYAKVAMRGGETEPDTLPGADVLPEPDTLHIFLNHWPSKYGGAAASEIKREAVICALENTLDSLTRADPGAGILVMGDLNDTPDAPSITALCRRQNLKNLTRDLAGGTIRYKGKWETIDQMLVSPLLAANARAEIFRPDFLLEDDRSFLGKKPRRTSIGPRYNGGASDHLPIVAILRATF